MSGKNRYLLVTGKPSSQNLSLYASSDKYHETSAIVLMASHFPQAEEILPWAKTYPVPVEIYDFIDLFPGYKLPHEQLSRFFQSQYFINALLISERMSPNPVGPNEAVSYVYEGVRAASAILEEIQPTLVLFPNVPHSLIAYVIYGLCKLSEIPVRLILTGTGFLPHLAYYTESLSTSFSEVIKQGDVEVDGDRLLSDLSREYIDERKRHTSPSYMLHQGISKNLAGNWQVPRKPIYRKLHDVSVEIIRAYKSSTRSYHKVPKFDVEGRIKDGKYIFFGLHYQPEATTMPMADLFAAQHIILRTLLDGLPEDFMLIVKEHPSMIKADNRDFYRYRSELFYKMCERSHNVRLVPPETNTEWLINHATAVATATGTLGVEAIANGIPVLLFGNSVLEDVERSFRCFDAIDVAKSISSIKEMKWAVDGAASLSNLAEKLESLSIDVPEDYVNNVREGKYESGKNLYWYYAASSISNMSTSIATNKKL